MAKRKQARVPATEAPGKIQPGSPNAPRVPNSSARTGAAGTMALEPASSEPWWARAWAAVGSDEWSTPLAIFFGSRLAILMMATLFFSLVPAQADTPPSVVDSLLRWDGGWYASIAKGGYAWAGPDKQSNVAFFPLYPLLARLVSFPLGGDVRTALILVSNVAFFVYLVYLYRLARRDFDGGTAERTLLYVAIFMLSFFLSAGYTEALMLALATASFYYAREGKWRAAIPLAVLVPLTRLAGIAIFLPLAWEWYKQRGLSWRAAVLLVVPAGLLLFMIYLGSLTGDPLAFNTVQRAWNKMTVWPWGMLGIATGLVTTLPLSRYVTSIAIVDFACLIGFLALIIAAIRFMPPAYWLYSLPIYFLSTSTALNPANGLPTASVGRYLMSIFPAFILMGMAGKNRYVHYILLFTFAILLGPLLLYFFAGIWVE